MIKNTRKSLWYGLMMLLLLPLGACSEEISVGEAPPQTGSDQEEEVDYRGYYYDGRIELSKAENDEKVYYISGPMMYPILYGHTIPIPVPNYESKIVVKLGEGTVIEQNAVKLVINDEELVRDMPSDGTVEYVEDGFSITRLSADEFEVKINPQAYKSKFGGYDDVKIVVRPIPYLAFDDVTGDRSTFLKFESPADYNLPAEIPLHFLPYTFTDSYRPIRQYHLYVY